MHAGLSNFGDQHEWTPTSGMDLWPLPISCLPGTQHLPSHSCPPAQKQMSQSQLLSPNTRTWSLLQTPPHPIPRNPFPSPKHISLFSCFRAPKQPHHPVFKSGKPKTYSPFPSTENTGYTLGLMTLGLEAQGHMSFFQAQSSWFGPLFWSKMSWRFAALKQRPPPSPCLGNMI